MNNKHVVIEDKQQKMEEKLCSSTLILHLISIASHTIVNKYVLSILQFQYPTVFISWQCGSCVFLLMSAYALGYIEQLGKIDRNVLGNWAPCMVFHAGIMYSGSISLSKLDIPIFLGLQNLIYCFNEGYTYWRSTKLPSMGIQFSLFIIGFGTIYLVYFDVNRDPVAYKWVFIYTVCSGCYVIFSQLLWDLELSHLDKVCCNSSFSVISLTCLSILTGEWKNTMDFPFLYYISFHIGCVCSGLLCFITDVLFNLLTKSTSSEKIKISKAANNALVSLVSFGIFDMTISTHVAFSVLLLLIGGIVYAYFQLKQSTIMTESENLLGQVRTQ